MLSSKIRHARARTHTHTHTLTTLAGVENSALCAAASERPWQEDDTLTTKDNKTSAVRISRILQSEVTDCAAETCGKARVRKQLFRKRILLRTAQQCSRIDCYIAP